MWRQDNAETEGGAEDIGRVHMSQMSTEDTIVLISDLVCILVFLLAACTVTFV